MRTTKGCLLKSALLLTFIASSQVTYGAVMDKYYTTLSLDPVDGICKVVQNGDPNATCSTTITYNVIQDNNANPFTYTNKRTLIIDGVKVTSFEGFPYRVDIATDSSVNYEITGSENPNAFKGTLYAHFEDYVPRFSHSTSTHNSLTGDFNGDGKVDAYYQPKLENVVGGILPITTSDFYDFNNYHREWATTHPDVPSIEDWSEESYGAFSANLTSSPGDEILLLGKREIVLIHGDIITPIVIPKAVPNAILSWDSNGTASLNTFDLDVDPANFNVLFADFDGDGNQDIFFQSNSTGGTSYIASQGGSVLQTLSNGYQGLDWSVGSTIVLQDENGDGRIDMRITDKDGNVFISFATSSGNFTAAPMSMTDAWKMKSSDTVDDAPLVTPFVPANEAVGAVEGQAGVSGGSATYGIPIAVAPGRAGMQPTVALSYSSRGGNGVAGVGWNVSYGSAISRCAANMAQDGIPASVQFVQNRDKLCLNGEKLFLVSGSSYSYGDSGAIYTTETENYLLVTQYGGDINDSTAWFKVERRDGSVEYYGQTLNSRHVLSGRTETLNWYLTKKHDSVHSGTDSSAKNVIHYDYATHGAGELLIDEIHYTGEGSTKGDRKVKFNYESRSDVTTSYLFGGKQRSTKRLDNIETYYANSLIRQYDLTYGYSRASGRSILKSVTECSANDVCLPATTFGWQDSPVKFELEEVNFKQNGTMLSTPPFRGEVRVENVIPYRDTNRDGASDWPGYFVNAEGDITGTNSLEHNECNLDGRINRHNCIEGDFDQDGRTDVWKQEDNIIKIGLVNDSHNVATWINTNIAVVDATNMFDFDAVRYINDFNADGWPDIAMYERRVGSREIRLFLHSGNINNPYSATGQLIFSYAMDGNAEYTTPEFLGDIDGNGIPDIVVSQTKDTQKHSGAPTPYPVSVQLFEYNGSVLSYTTYALNLSEDQTNSEYFSHFIDVNGDGLLDWLGWRNHNLPLKPEYNRLDGELILRINKGGLEFSDVISLGGEAALEAIFYTTGLPGTPNNPNPFGETDSHLLPMFSSSFRSMDVNGDGRIELLIPGNRLMDGCITQLVGPNAQYETVCGEEIYSTYMSDPWNGASTAPWPASLDSSIHEYDAIYFDEDANGNITARRASTGLIGSANQLAVTDAFGEGLSDAIFTVGPLTVSASLDRAGSTYSGVPNDGAYINRNTGSAPYGTRYAPSDMMTSVTNGLDNSSAWHYKPLSSSHTSSTGLKLYSTDHEYIDDDTSDPGSRYHHFSSSMYVVHKFDSDNGVGGTNSTEYGYRGAVYNGEGRGFQGFRTIIVDTPSELNATGEVSAYARAVTDFNQKFPKAGTIESTRNCLVDDNDELCTTSPLSSESYVYEHKVTSFGAIKVLPVSVTKKTMALNNRNMVILSTNTVINSVDIDSFGNVLESTTTVNNGFSTVEAVATNSYLHNDSSWPWGKLDYTRAKTRTMSGSPVYDSNLDPIKEIKTEYTWTANHQPDSVTNRPLQGGGKVLVVDTDYNTYGLPSTVKTYEEGDIVNAKSVTTTYSNNGTVEGENGYFVYSVSNDLNHSVITKRNPFHGLVTTGINENQLQTETEYDEFGRIEKVTPPLGTGQPAYSRYAACDGNCDGLSTKLTITDQIKYKVTTYMAGAPEATVYKDKFNRVLISKFEGFDGTPIYSLVQYDALGRKAFESIPSFDANPTKGIQFKRFDALGRMTLREVDQPYNQLMTVSYAYVDHTTNIIVSSAGRDIEMSRTYSGNGQLMQTMQKEGATEAVTQYAYDSIGNPIVLQDAKGNPIKAEYNALGQKKYVNDPNMGYKSFTYTEFGEVDTETDANNDTYDYEYDILGRLIERKLNGVLEASFYFDTAAKGATGDYCVGLPVGEDREDLTAGESFGRTYSYDNKCRVKSVSTNIDGTSYLTSTQYDGNYGRVKAVTFPTGLTVSSTYNDRGYLTHTVNAASGYVYQQTEEMNARMQITHAKKAAGMLSEGADYWEATGQMHSVHTNATNTGTQRHRIVYQYDGFGNLERQDVENMRGLDNILSHETYTYDDLHRLEKSTRTVDGVLQPSIDYDYDILGNFTLKDDYATSFTYGDINKTNNNAGPNAVRSVNLATGGTKTFSYDNNGNRTHENGAETIRYNPFNKPVWINKGGVVSTFRYGADQMRYKQIKTGKPNGTETTLYIDKAYEEIHYDGEKHKKVYLGDAVITEIENGDVEAKIGFIHRDRLNSVVTITDENGNVIDNKSYDPFGKPRKGTMARVDPTEPANLTRVAEIEGYVSPGDQVKLTTRRGFTDHEHLDDAELIHMKGRVYDYNIGRFLSVDPFIKDSDNSQGINPYSYIMNNPLGGTDPTGYNAVRCNGRIDCNKKASNGTGRDSGSQPTQLNGDNATDNGSELQVKIKIKEGSRDKKQEELTVNDIESVTVDSGHADYVHEFSFGGTNEENIANELKLTESEVGLLSEILENGINSYESGEMAKLIDREIDSKSYGKMILGKGKDLVESVTRKSLESLGDGKGSISIAGFRTSSVGPITAILTLGVSADGDFFIVLDAGLGKAAGVSYSSDGDFPMPENLRSLEGDASSIGLVATAGLRVGPLGGSLTSRGILVDVTDENNKSIGSGSGTFEGPSISGENAAFGVSGGVLVGITFGYKFHDR